jgi:hypothetical protein
VIVEKLKLGIFLFSPVLQVTELETPSGKKTLPHQYGDKNSQCHSGGQGVGSAQSMGKMSGTIVSPQNHPSMGPLCSHGSTMHSAGRKAQLTNANHLLNFHYDPIPRPQLNINQGLLHQEGSGRRSHTTKIYFSRQITNLWC